MLIPFPSLTPRLIDSKWFNADSPCDDEAELTAMEQVYQNWFNMVGQMYSKRVPLGKTEPEPMEEEAESDEEEGNEESDESEESHDEELRMSYSPTTAVPNNNLTDALDDLTDVEFNEPADADTGTT